MFKIFFILLVKILTVSFTFGAVDLEIRGFFIDYVQSINNREYSVISEAWNIDGELITLAGGIYKGRDEIKHLYKKGLESSYKGATFHYVINYIRGQTEDFAIVDGIWKVTGGGPINYPSCGIFLYNLSRRNGTWGIDMAYSSVPRRGHTREHGRIISWTKVCDQK
ncbi:hypothetical protein OAT67_08475 [Bacteriovoracaceae bacterium]|nr:hypothetical protein [Bacteriovoracaceae bacterium]